MRIAAGAPGRRAASPAAERERAMFESNDIDGRWRVTAPAAGGGWRNPPYAVRVGLVAAVWVVPGVLLGLTAALFLLGVCDPAAVATAGGVVFGAAGAWQEAFE